MRESIRLAACCGAKSVYQNVHGPLEVEKNIDTEDAIQALVRFENGAIGTFESCWVLPNSMPAVTDSFIEIIGEKGMIHSGRLLFGWISTG